MTEPAMAPEQSRLLWTLFAQIIRMECCCDVPKTGTCNRCNTVFEIEELFPGLFRQACIYAARWPK